MEVLGFVYIYIHIHISIYAFFAGRRVCVQMGFVRFGGQRILYRGSESSMYTSRVTHHMPGQKKAPKSPLATPAEKKVQNDRRDESTEQDPC